MSYYARHDKHDEYDHYIITRGGKLFPVDLLIVNFYNINHKFSPLPNLKVGTSGTIEGSRWFIYRQMNFSWLWFSIVYSYKFDEELIDYDS